MKMNKIDGISVIICCYNSEWIISRCLNALINQKLTNSIKWEIVLVNNCCIDETEEIARSILEKSKVKYKILEESSPGLMNARKRGVYEADYCYLIFCDDDNILSENYVYNAYSLMNTNPRMGGCGGCGIAEFDGPADAIIKDNLRAYAVGSQIKHGKEWLYGAGICVRKEVVEKIYRSHKMYLTGRKGDILMAGDDSELVYLIRILGYELSCDDNLKFTHVLNRRRLTRDYFLRLVEGFSYTMPILTVYRIVVNKKNYNYLYIQYFKTLLGAIVNSITLKENKRIQYITSLKSTIKAIKYWKSNELRDLYNSLILS